jgi:hypothetical protein
MRRYPTAGEVVPGIDALETPLVTTGEVVRTGC